MNFRFGRDALKYLIKHYGIKEIYIPYYLCDVIRHAVFEIGCKPLFYHIDDVFMPSQDFPKDAYILYPNYFGICDNNVDILVAKYPKLIVDNAHAYYAEPKGFASFNSAKKFLPVSEGASLWLSSEKNKNFTPQNKDYGRRQRFLYYYDKLQITNLLNINIKEDAIPFCYPYLAQTEKEANKIVDELEKKNITVYRYWNRLPKSYNEYKFFERLVPIPLDK